MYNHYSDCYYFYALNVLPNLDHTIIYNQLKTIINMEKNVTSVRNLVLDNLTGFSTLKNSADKGDAMSCFKMGMIHLLGIKTPVNFDKANYYFSNQSLADDYDSSNLQGFIAECEGMYSLAFHKYAKSDNSEKKTYIDRVIKGRNNLKDYLTKLGLPIALNKDISAILSDYSKGKASKVGATIKIAAICNDEQTCLEAAQVMYNSKNYISAINWLVKGSVGLENPLYAAINDYFAKSKCALLCSQTFQVVDLNSNSIFSFQDPTPFLNKVKKACDEASSICKKEWIQQNKKVIDNIVKKQERIELLEEEKLEKIAKEKSRKIKAAIISLIPGIVLDIVIFQMVDDDKRTGTDWLWGVLTIIIMFPFCFWIIYDLLKKIDE